EVADVRGSTPTDCARRLVPDKKNVLFTIQSIEKMVAKKSEDQIRLWSRAIDENLLHASHWLKDVHGKFEIKIAAVSEQMQFWFARLTDGVSSILRLFRSFDPKQVMARGFAIVRDASGRIQTGTKNLKTHESARIEMRDGTLETLIQSIKQTLL
ncbi:MAG TPA: hypothetical protein VFQ60_00960, partial [Patescibacteria group bacterium]|nr:hypothetical protein [Patescibacteria group bacterium]